MSLETGGVHPLAKEPDLPLDTQLPVNLLDVRADIIGDHIVLVLVDLRPDNPESDAIYLVDWKQGRITLVRPFSFLPGTLSRMESFIKVHRAPNGTYEGALAVLSPDLVIFLKRKTPSLELCRVTRGGAGATRQSPPSLRVVCTLALPAFHPDCHVHTAYMQTDRHYERRPRTMSTAAIQRRQRHREQELEEEEEQGEEQPSPLPFHSAPEDMVVGITFLLRERGPRAIWKKVVTTISHRALFALASTFDDPPTYDGAEDDGDDDDDGEEEEVEVEVEEEEVPWEEWGPSSARVIAPPSFQWITAYAGQRWLSLESDKLVIRDFSAARVRRAITRPRARRTSAELLCGNLSANDNTNRDDNRRGYGRGYEHRRRHSAAKGCGNGWSLGCFAEEVVSELLFLETRIDAPGRDGAMVLTDGERLVAFVRKVSFTTSTPPYPLSLFFVQFFFGLFCLGRVSPRRLTYTCLTIARRDSFPLLPLDCAVLPAISLACMAIWRYPVALISWHRMGRGGFTGYASAYIYMYTHARTYIESVHTCTHYMLAACLSD